MYCIGYARLIHWMCGALSLSIGGSTVWRGGGGHVPPIFEAIVKSLILTIGAPKFIAVPATPFWCLLPPMSLSQLLCAHLIHCLLILIQYSTSNKATSNVRLLLSSLCMTKTHLTNAHWRREELESMVIIAQFTCTSMAAIYNTLINSCTRILLVGTLEIKLSRYTRIIQCL